MCVIEKLMDQEWARNTQCSPWITFQFFAVSWGSRQKKLHRSKSWDNFWRIEIVSRFRILIRMVNNCSQVKLQSCDQRCWWVHRCLLPWQDSTVRLSRAHKAGAWLITWPDSPVLPVTFRLFFVFQTEYVNARMYLKRKTSRVWTPPLVYVQINFIRPLCSGQNNKHQTTYGIPKAAVFTTFISIT